MEAFALVEADFQQFYHLDLVQVVNERYGFLRFCRLFVNLPAEGRLKTKYAPAGGWTYRDETLSRILHEIADLKSVTYNSKRKKGQKPIKTPEQFQPDYVKKAKDDYIKRQKKLRNRKEDAAAMRNFWQSRNPDVKVV